MTDGTPVIVRQHGNPSGPRLVFSHGIGFAIDQYYPLWSLFCELYEVIVYDLRYHGWNAVSDFQDQGIPTLIHDQQVIHENIQTLFGAKPTVGVFHSISALASLLSPSGGSEFTQRILVEPLVCTSRSGYRQFVAIMQKGVQIVASRIERFQSMQDYATLLRNTQRFDLLTPAALDLMAETTLRPSRDGNGYELRCPREFEAKIMDECKTYAHVSKFTEMRCPTLVIGADIQTNAQFFLFPPIEPHSIPGADYNFVSGTTHFLPLEKPEDCAAKMWEYIGSNPELSSTA